MTDKRKNPKRQNPYSSANTTATSLTSTQSTFFGRRFALGTAVSLGMVGLSILWMMMRNEELTLDQDPAQFYYSDIPNDFNPEFIFATDEKDRAELITREGITALQAFMGTANELADLIFKDLSCMFSFNLLIWLFVKHQNFNIRFAPPQFLQPQGAYRIGNVEENPDNAQILIRADTELLNETNNNLHRTLYNEFFHRICDQANENKTKKDSQRRLPFLDANGEVDNNLRDKYSNALEMANKRIDRLQELLTKTYLTPKQKKELGNANSVLSDYKPHIYKIPLSSKKVYDEALKSCKKINGQIILPAGTLLDADVLNTDMVITSTRNKGNSFDIFLKYNGTNAEVFIKDIQDFRTTFKTIPAYTNLSADKSLAEAGSDLNMLTPTCKQFFAPEFCRYMDEYTNMEKNSYCAIPQSSRCFNAAG